MVFDIEHLVKELNARKDADTVTFSSEKPEMSRWSRLGHLFFPVDESYGLYEESNDKPHNVGLVTARSAIQEANLTTHDIDPIIHVNGRMYYPGTEVIAKFAQLPHIKAPGEYKNVPIQVALFYCNDTLINRVDQVGSHYDNVEDILPSAMFRVK